VIGRRVGTKVRTDGPELGLRAQKSGKRRRSVKPSSTAAALTAAPCEDPVAVELRRISEQPREQRGL
jgi:hypothetical protein